MNIAHLNLLILSFLLLASGCSKGSIYFPNLNQFVTSSVPFNLQWPFNSTDPTLYNCVAPVFELVGGVCRLYTPDQTDDDDTCEGFRDGSGPTCGGSFSGVNWGEANTLNPNYTSHDVLRLNTLTNTAELHESWTPKWGNIAGYWKLNETSWSGVSGEVTDSSANANHGQASGNIVGTTGRIGAGAASFNGTNYLSAPHSASLDISGNITLMAWIRVQTFTSGWQNIVSKGAHGYRLQRYGFSNTLEFGGNAGTGTPNVVGSIPMDDGKWHHVVATVNATNARLYVDGMLDRSSSGGNLWTNTDPVTIGENFGHSGRIWNGDIDEVVVWNETLTAKEVALIYSRQTAKYSGTFTSRVMDALALASNWDRLSWVPSLPFMKSLPDATCSPGPICVHANSESSIDFSSLVGSTGSLSDNNLMSGIVGLWHLDDTILGMASGADIKDDSGKGNHLTVSGGVSINTQGKLNSAILLNGSNSYATISPSTDLKPTASLTGSAWFRTSFSANGQDIFSMGASYLIRVLPGGQIKFEYYNGSTWLNVIYATNVADGNWHHAVGVKSATAITLYIDGVPVTSLPDSGSISYVGLSPNFRLGQDPNANGGLGGNYFNGQIDEVAIWNRALHQNEVLQLYRRGSNRIKYQVRICTAPDCTESGAADKWKGPDGTKFTYFSELNNTTTYDLVNNIPSGSVKKGPPSLNFADFTNPVGTSRFFQYRTILESDDTSASCDYGSGPTWCSPELKSVKIGPDRYSTSSPTVTGTVGSSFTALSSFVQTLGSGGCSSGLTNNLGVEVNGNPVVWYYWDGATWSAAPVLENVAQSNPAAVISANLPSFAAQAGVGTVYFKAFFGSSGSTRCELDHLILQGTR